MSEKKKIEVSAPIARRAMLAPDISYALDHADAESYAITAAAGGQPSLRGELHSSILEES